MLIKAAKWGNSLGLRLPKLFAEQVKINEGSLLEIIVDSGNIVIKPVNKENDLTLDNLLEGVTPENYGSEIKYGKPVGKEVW